MREKRFNLVGFNFSNSSNYLGYEHYRHCSIHPYKRLLESKTDPDNLLFCPECGSEYPVKDTIEEQNIKSDLPSNSSSGPKIISAKRKKKKYYDKHGNEITDPLLIRDIMQGKTVISYHEVKQGEE